MLLPLLAALAFAQGTNAQGQGQAPSAGGTSTAAASIVTAKVTRAFDFD